MNQELCFGQKIDPENGLIQPWLTHGALDQISKMNLSEKVIWMFGAGMGDIWLAKRCKTLYVVERNQEWLTACTIFKEANKVDNLHYNYRPCNDSDGQAEYYTELQDGIAIIINDDAYRTEVCQVAVDYFKEGGGGILICDNYWQDFVWKSPKAIEILEPFRKNIYLQEDHKDHEGDGWKTAIVYI